TNNAHNGRKSLQYLADVEKHGIAFLLQLQPFEKRKRGSLDASSLQGLSARRAVADTVEDFVIPIPHQSLFGKPLDGGIFRDAAGAGDPDDFTLQVVELCDSFGADERVILVGLHAVT